MALGATCLLFVIGCTSAPATPTTAPAPTAAPAKPAASPAAASPAPSPVASPSVAASPAALAAASPAASPAASVVPSPSAAAAVASPSPSAAAVDNSPYQSAILFSGSPTAGFTLQSTDITANTTIPVMFTCAAPGGGTSPQLSWSGAPANTQSYVLVEQDPDTATPNTHWLVYNIPASVTQLAQGQTEEQATLSNGAMQGQDHAQGIFPTFALIGYEGACPPPGAPAHHYTFQLFALDQMLNVPPGANINVLKAAMAGHILAQTELVAPFNR